MAYFVVGAGSGMSRLAVLQRRTKPLRKPLWSAPKLLSALSITQSKVAFPANFEFRNNIPKAATEAATRESVGDLAARFGGDVSNPLFNFLQQTTRAAGAATGAGQRLGIEVEEARRAQDIGLQKQQLRLGFGQLGLSRRANFFS